MPSTTEVRDRDAQGALAVSLTELLTLLATHLGPVDWHILQLKAVGAEWGDTDLDALHERIQKSPSGTPIDPEELFQLAGELERVDDALLCVPASGATPRRPVDDRFYRDCRVALQCVQGERWSVTSDDVGIHELLRENFQDVVSSA